MGQFDPAVAGARARLRRSARGRWSLLGCVAAGALLAGCTTPAESLDAELAFRHAPVHFQDTDDSSAISDFITAGDYDGDWLMINNWDNLSSRADLRARAYYSVVESCTHWFIAYGFFHPRDWVNGTFDQEHENDLEGLLAIVRKDGSRLGRLEGIITVFHNDFFSYKPAGGALTEGEEDIDGHLDFQLHGGVSRYKTSQEAEGHGLKAWPHAGNFDGGAGQDGIIYFPSTAAGEAPASGDDRDVAYDLRNLYLDMWLLQQVDAGRPPADRQTFHDFGSFRGDESGGCGSGVTVTCSENAANSPWGWDDGDDGATFAGEMALDPAHLVDHYFNGLGDFDPNYVRNRYLETLQAGGWTDANRPAGWPSQLSLAALYAKLGSTCRPSAG